MSLNKIQNLRYQHLNLIQLADQFEDKIVAECWLDASHLLSEFNHLIDNQISYEEGEIFNYFEHMLKIHSAQSPFQILRFEHEDICKLMRKLPPLIANKRKGQVLNISENLMLLIYEHFKKEETIIVPLIS